MLFVFQMKLKQLQKSGTQIPTSLSSLCTKSEKLLTPRLVLEASVLQILVKEKKCGKTGLWS